MMGILSKESEERCETKKFTARALERGTGKSYEQ